MRPSEAEAGAPSPRPVKRWRERVRLLRWRWAVLALMALCLTLGLGTYGAIRYRLGIDLQAHSCLESARVFLIDTFAGPEDVVQGDLVAFRAQGLGVPAFEGQLFVKHAAGVPGDWVTVTPAATAINGMPMAQGLALAPALQRDPASLARHERVPVEHFWMLGETADSFDSRYWGFLPVARMIGKAYALF
ncbi:signal peptidase I [Thiorhodococcus minor]|uniref:Signal peptidase I n=1 Tax=Thiorhodococcus minor TaxID=57489 RepID=A0A6M0K6P1_9GAMM|nr:signal peptidase I [Thiorhodococcus minor]NEV64991.1 signal peptidase I [Thiorhodococcus minor]